MFKTINGGLNWYEQDMSQFNQGYIEDIHFINDITGWAIGAATKILFTTNGGGPLVSISNISNEIPNGFILEQNYPNQFNPVTKIKIHIPLYGNVSLEMY